MVNFSLEGKVALVTGASYGIGFAIASAYAQAGATIVFNDIKQELVNKGLAAYEELGIKAHGYVCDVTDEEQVNALVAKIEKEVGVIDILVNNAGIIKRIPMCEMSAAEFRQVIDVDLNAPFIVSKAVIPSMIKKGHGKIINISSGSGIIGCEFCSHYASAKAGLIGFTQSIAKELGKDHINANAIAVPTTQTPMLKETDFDVFVEDELRDIPWGRIGTPEDIADMVLYLASDASEYVTGQVLAPNGGRRTPV